MDRGYSLPGCRNRRFKDGGREATLIVRILSFPRMMVGTWPKSSDSLVEPMRRVHCIPKKSDDRVHFVIVLFQT